MTVAFNNVAGGKPLAESRRHNRPPEPWKAYLPSVRMTRKRQCHPIRDVWKHVRIVRQQNYRRPIVLYCG